MKQGGATGKVLMKGKTEIFITFAQRLKWGFDAPSVWKTKIYSNVGNHDLALILE